MASFDKCVVPVIVVFLACLELVQSRCATGSFYLRKEHRCKPCSPCPVNEIIRTPCSRHHDNICGPFYEFNKFHLEHKGDMSPQEQRVEFMPKVEHVKGSSYENDEHHEEGTYQSTSVSHIQGNAFVFLWVSFFFLGGGGGGGGLKFLCSIYNFL